MSKHQDPDSQPVCRTTAGFPVVDGPLVGEFHDRGESFEFRDSLTGSEDDEYRLVGGTYVWTAGHRERING